MFRSKILCPLCKSALEDEIHFMLFCSKLSAIRKQYLPYFLNHNQTSFKYISLWNRFDFALYTAIAKYIHYSMEFRKRFVNL